MTRSLPPLLEAHKQEIAALCELHGVDRLEAFGSLVDGDFDSERSDADLVVEFDLARSRDALHQYFDFKSALERLLERPVDLVELGAMENTRLRRAIVRSKVPVYAKTA
jgi:hypothetical protein